MGWAVLVDQPLKVVSQSGLVEPRAFTKPSESVGSEQRCQILNAKKSL